MHSEKPLAGSYAAARVARRPGGGPRACGSRARRSRSWARRSRRCGGSSSRVRSDACASRMPRSTGTGSRAGTLARSPSTASGRSRTSACIRSRSSRPCSGPARRVTAFGTIVYPDRTTLTGEPFTPGGAGLRRRRRRARERNRRAPHRELLRLAPHEAERDRAPRRHGLDLPLRLAGVRRDGRARAVRRAVPTVSRWRTRSAAPTGGARSAT